jgi:hypothetical protein
MVAQSAAGAPLPRPGACAPTAWFQRVITRFLTALSSSQCSSILYMLR